MTVRRAIAGALAAGLLLPSTGAGHPGTRPAPPPNLEGLPHLIPKRDRPSYHSQVSAVRPELAELQAEVLGPQDLLEITWKGETPLIVVGRHGEPMFRLTPKGVEVNQRSPTTYEAAERFGRVPAPPAADADAEPQWQLLAPGPGPWRWHDPRIQWRRARRPDSVRGDERTLIRRWSIPVRAGTRDARVEGVLEWIPSADAIRAERSDASDPLTSGLVLLIAMAVGAWTGRAFRARIRPLPKAGPAATSTSDGGFSRRS